MQQTTVILSGQRVTRYVCNRGHPHPTSAGAQDCEDLRANGASEVELAEHLASEVAEFNAAIHQDLRESTRPPPHRTGLYAKCLLKRLWWRAQRMSSQGRRRAP